MTNLTEPVVDALTELRTLFKEASVEATPDGAGGAMVVIDEVDIGPKYSPKVTWLGFHLNSVYPYSDVYPHYIGRVERADGSAHGAAVQVVDWQGRPALQLSRRSNRWNPNRDNATLKAQKVLSWLGAQ